MHVGLLLEFDPNITIFFIIYNKILLKSAKDQKNSLIFVIYCSLTTIIKRNLNVFGKPLKHDNSKKTNITVL